MNGEQVIYDNAEDDEHPNVAPATTSVDATLPPHASFKIKRVDNYYSSWSKAWKFRNTGSSFIPEALTTVGNGARDGNDPWQDFCFVVVRKLPKSGDDGGEPTYQVVVKSPYLLKACKDVIQKVQGVSWTDEPVELDPHLLLTFLSQFEKYRDDLRAKSKCTSEETTIMKTVDVLLEYLHTDYKGTIAKFNNLTAHGEITFDTLFALFVPRTVVVTNCPTTGEPCALQIVSTTKVNTGVNLYELLCESVDAFDDVSEGGSWDAYSASRFNPTAATSVHIGAIIPSAYSAIPGAYPVPPGNPADAGIPQAARKTFGRVQSRIFVSHFKGTVNISSLDVYPIIYHPDAGRLKLSLIARGKKWLELRGIHHMQYDGPAGYTLSCGGSKSTIKYSVKSRIMVDRGNFRRLNPNYKMPVVKAGYLNLPPVVRRHPGSCGYYPREFTPVSYNPNSNVPTLKVRARAPQDAVELTEDELMLTPSFVYGFSLTDKTWLEFNIRHVQPIVWNDEAFANLVLPADRKILLQSLVEAHNGDLSFDDFVNNKGRGLVINLFGPPGVGKTLSAEATSEHVRKPLYVVGAGDLGTHASTLDQSLDRVFDIATSWKAIVLIDEADVFLEQRSLHDMARNAMVAVFLRHVEYYHGILFMTTNRVKAFDEAFLSRIHVALHFRDLTRDARKQVWAAFLSKVGVAPAQFEEALLDKLAEREVNGRQMKNAVRTASSLAAKKGVRVSYADLMATLDAMDEFTAEFRDVRQVDA